MSSNYGLLFLQPFEYNFNLYRPYLRKVNSCSLSVHTRGVPQADQDGVYTPSQVRKGYPQLDGGTPGQDRIGGILRQIRMAGSPGQDWRGYPSQGWVPPQG